MTSLNEEPEVAALSKTEEIQASAMTTTSAPPALPREGSFDEPLEPAEDGRVADYERPNSSDDEEYYVNLPPGRMHATRVPERLTGSTGNLHIPPGLTTILRKKLGETAGVGGTGVVAAVPSGGSPRSRSRSPSVKEKTTTTTHPTDANSSISSFDDIADQDILYDRGGFVELAEADFTSDRRKLHNSREFTNLPPVCERSSEDMLEDAHAFNDPVIVRSSNASRANSIGTGADQFLEPLNEDDEEDDLDDITEEGDSEHETQVIVTNLDNLSLSEDYRMAAGAGTRGTGESSLMEEAPSAPTA
jgi:hypothetical protein